VGAGREAATDLRLVFAQQVVDELFSRVPRKGVGWIHETQGRRRDDRLLHGQVRVAPHVPQKLICVPPVPKRAAGEPRHPPRVAGGEGNSEAIRMRVG
jgi:hypothetical protein